MKRLIAIFMMMLMSISMAFAQTAVPLQNNDNRGFHINPDSPFLWGIDKALDNLAIRLQFNEFSRAQMALKVAQERQEEVQEMVEKNKPEAANKATEEWQKHIEEAVKTQKKLQAEGDENAQTLESNIRNRVQVLEQVRQRLVDDENPNNDNALQGIDNALENTERERHREYEADDDLDDDLDEENETESEDDDSPGTGGSNNGPNGKITQVGIKRE